MVKKPKLIQISDDVAEFLERNGKFRETYNEVLTRILNIRGEKSELEIEVHKTTG
jgi:predicted nuclease with TOPRIM domain